MDTIEIRGSKYRVEVNWNVLTRLCEMKGIKDISAIDKVATFSPEEIQTLIFLCLEQGALIEGKTLDLSLEDIGLYVKVGVLNKFLAIFKSQVDPGYTVDGSLKKKKRMFTRR